MKKLMLVFLIVLTGQIKANEVNESTKEKRIYYANRLQQSPPIIDGILNDDIWLSEGWQSGFVELLPNEGQEPTKQTKFKIVYDKNNIYAAIFCFEDNGKIKKHFAPRDEYIGDLAGFAFDSYFNKQTAYEFNLTAAGQKLDIMHIGNGNYDSNWNPNWTGAVALTDSGWAAEFKIPFSQLRYNNMQEQAWGLHVWRWRDINSEESHWQLMPSNAPQGVHNFGVLQGISNIRTSRQTEFLPYLSVKGDYNGRNDNPYINSWKFVPNGGLDVKLGISSNYTLDATINPDFGQVEADPADLNLSAYETYFEEKRPFFMEGKDIFDFSVGENQLFYSRRIGAEPHYFPDITDNKKILFPDKTLILGSVKLTGRSKRGLSIGILETVTNPEYAKIYTGDSLSQRPDIRNVLTEPLTNYFAGRFKKESAEANTLIGGSFNSVIRNLTTDELRDNLVSSAQTAEVDFKQQFFDKNYYLKSSAMFSYLDGSPEAVRLKQESAIHEFQRPDAPHLTLDTTKESLYGTEGFLEIGKQGGKLQFWANGSFRSPGLDFNDIGYLNETDVIEQEAGLKLSGNEPHGIFRGEEWKTTTNNKWTLGKEHIGSNIVSELWLLFKNQWETSINGEYQFPALDVRILRGGPALYRDGYYGGKLWLKTDHTKRIWGSAFNTCFFNKTVDYITNYHEVKLNLNPIDRFRLSTMLSFENTDSPYEYFETDLPQSLNHYMVGRLRQQTAGLTLRAEFYIKPEISFQYYGNPYVTTINYFNFKRVKNAGAKNISDRFYSFNAQEISYNQEQNNFAVNENNGSSYTFDNPDQSYSDFRSNFVFRWEYKLGSTFYFVWSHRQGKDDYFDSPHLDETALDLFKTAARDVFMIKLSYWFSL